MRAFFARLPDGTMNLFCYYLLGSDTAAPSGLYARLCHAFLVYFDFLLYFLIITFNLQFRTVQIKLDPVSFQAHVK